MRLPPESELIRRHVIDVAQVPWPIDVEELFGRSGPLVVEIGFGNGAFAEDQALAHPEWNYLAIEVSWACVQHLLRRIHHQGIENIRIIRADAAFVLREMIAAGSLETAFVNHPDPWPKERHHGRRLLQQEFVALLASRLRSGQSVRIATDHADYAEWIGEVLENQSNLESIFDTTEVPELPGHLVTKYQAKAQAQGIGNHFFVWKKVVDDETPAPRREPEAMPNVTLKSRSPADDANIVSHLFEGFESIRSVERYRGLEIVVNLQRLYARSEQPGQWLIETTVKDGAFFQQLALLVTASLGDEGHLEIVVQVSGIGHPRATYGVKKAVRLLASLLPRRHPDLEVVNSTVGDLVP